MYIYTPHISFSTARIMKEIQGDVDLLTKQTEILGIFLGVLLHFNKFTT